MIGVGLIFIEILVLGVLLWLFDTTVDENLEMSFTFAYICTIIVDWRSFIFLVFVIFREGFCITYSYQLLSFLSLRWAMYI